jgi:hypothetical protein
MSLDARARVAALRARAAAAGTDPLVRGARAAAAARGLESNTDAAVDA